MAKKAKSGKRFVKATVAVLLTVSALIGGVCVAVNNRYNRISNESQVETIAKAIGCDLSYMKYNDTGGVIRMIHNGKEPIYVHIKDEMKDEQGVIQDSLDYIFGIVGKINENYKYKLVDEEECERQKDLGKTTIVYQEGPCETKDGDADGLIYRDQDKLEKWSDNDYYSSYVIEYSKEQAVNFSYNEKLSVFIHELLHAFGLDDVYLDGAHKVTDTNHQNTIMKNHREIVITPNDFKCMLSAYKEKVSESELQEYIKKADIVAKEYESYYYKNRVERLKDYEQEAILDLQGKDVNSNFKQTLTKEDGSKIEQQIKVDIVGDKYTLIISGANRSEECVAIGKVFEQDGVKILKNVEFTGAFELSDAEKIKKTIMDLYLVRLEDKDLLYDVNTLSSMWGTNMKTEGNLDK